MQGRTSVNLACCIIVLCALGTADAQNHNDDAHKLVEGEKKMSDQILEIIEHFKDPDPIGMPGADIPDPYSVPDTKQSFPVATMAFKNMAVYGISKFRILYISAEIAEMEVNAAMSIDKLQVLGNYTMSTWLSRSQGPFTVNLTELRITARANLGVELDGRLQAQDMAIDIGFNNIAMNFENLGFFGAMFQGMVNSVGNFLFDSIKPFILKEAYSKMRAEINTKLDEVAGDMKFPNSISPLDMVIAKLRKRIRAKHFDPYFLQDYNATMSVFQVKLAPTWITGTSSFHRVGNISLRMKKNTVVADFEIGTQKLQGMTNWDISAIGGVISRAGTASFSVEYVSARVVLAQSLDTRKKPELRNVDFEIGNIQVRCNGAGTVDYIIEFVVNILPNLLRYQILDAAEGPIKSKIQDELNKYNVEQMIVKDVLPNVDKIQETGFKLSAMMEADEEEKEVNENTDDDEFFNF